MTKTDRKRLLDDASQGGKRSAMGPEEDSADPSNAKLLVTEPGGYRLVP